MKFAKGTGQKIEGEAQKNTVGVALNGAPTDPAAHRPLDESHDKARTRREIAQANLAELKLAELSGELVRADDVRHALARRFVAFREGLLQIPDRLSAQLAAETDQGTIRRLLDIEIRASLTHLVEAGRLTKEAPADAAR